MSPTPLASFGKTRGSNDACGFSHSQATGRAEGRGASVPTGRAGGKIGSWTDSWLALLPPCLQGLCCRLSGADDGQTGIAQGPYPSPS